MVTITCPDGRVYHAHAKFAEGAENGVRGLASEFLASRLAQLLGAGVPPVEIVDLPESQEIKMRDGIIPTSGLVAASETMASNFCPACGVAQGPGAQFCAACGHDLNAPSVHYLPAGDSGRADAMQAAMDAAPKAIDDPRMYGTQPPEPGSLQAQMMAENASRQQGVTHEQMDVPPPPSYDAYNDPDMPPPPATPASVTMPRKTGNGLKWVAAAGAVALSIGAAVYGPGILNSIPNNTNGNSNDQTATSGVDMTGGSLNWGSCDAVTKGYLPGGSDCKATIKLTYAKPVATGEVVVEMFYGGSTSDPMFHNNLPYTPSAAIVVTAESVPSCRVNPKILVLVYDRHPSDPSANLLGRFDATITDDCAGFPQGGL